MSKKKLVLCLIAAMSVSATAANASINVDYSASSHLLVLTTNAGGIADSIETRTSSVGHMGYVALFRDTSDALATVTTAAADWPMNCEANAIDPGVVNCHPGLDHLVNLSISTFGGNDTVTATDRAGLFSAAKIDCGLGLDSATTSGFGSPMLWSC